MTPLNMAITKIELNKPLFFCFQMDAIMTPDTDSSKSGNRQQLKKSGEAEHLDFP